MLLVLEGLQYAGSVRFADRHISVYGASSLDMAVLRVAATMLNLFLPAGARHVARRLREIHVDPGACGADALACTHGGFGRNGVLNVRPSRAGMIETAVSLVHEALHWRWIKGRWYAVDHDRWFPVWERAVRRALS